MFSQDITDATDSVKKHLSDLSTFFGNTLFRQSNVLEPATIAITTNITQAPKSPNQSPSQNSNQYKKSFKKILMISFSFALLSLFIVSGYFLYQYFTNYQSTDDAYTTGHIHAISARVNGTVEKVLVDDNEHVKAGQSLVALDPRDYQVRVEQALAALQTAKHQAEVAKISIAQTQSNASGKTTETAGLQNNAIAAINKAQAKVNEAKFAVPQTQAELAQKQAEEIRSLKDRDRYKYLAEQGAVSYQQYDNALRDYQVAKEGSKAAKESVSQALARVQQAQQSVDEAKAQLTQSKGLAEQAHSIHIQSQVNSRQYDVAMSAINQAQSQLDDAKLQLSYTNIISPVDGRVGKKTVEAGQRIQPGQALMNVVADDMWVVANFKETQLERMRAGQNVKIKIDSFPHHDFYGKVDSISPGSGATFALLPPDNATGNFTKIVQRVPVKIIFDKNSIKGFEQLIVPGMSAIVTIDVKNN
jgi:membrane fusion protein (multidrug efflux system)